MELNYKETLNLPNTDFPMKANLAEREPQQIKSWDEVGLYHKMIAANKGNKRYVFHDGPPYANGGIHHGHILNKVLKDIVVKYKAMTGYLCEFVPGWDCHGLPIEIEVDKVLGSKKKEMSQAEIRKFCRAHATKFVDLQREEFKRLGCVARWEKPYQTMSFDYEASIAREFGNFVKCGGLYKGKKPIYWCASCRTALAEAEVEYADHTSPSIYVKFKLKDDADVRSSLGLGNEPIYLVIWTTTPWTIPANLGIALNPELDYAAVRVGTEIWIVAEKLIDSVMKAAGKANDGIVGRPKAIDLEKKNCAHPLVDRDSLIILGEHVTLEAGTGAVHTAPGHGQEDYEVGLKYNLPAFAPIDAAGKFTDEALLPWLKGMHVEAANKPIIEKLEELGSLVKCESISHSYPHCWRCKKPVVFRATDQWFISMEKNSLREKAMAAIESSVQWIPPWGKSRIGGMVAVRPDWCISRQRLWGVPIVALICESCGEAHTTPQLCDRAVQLFAKEGADAWYERGVEDFKPADFSCPKCGEKKNFRKESDILDVWFDSGVSYAAVMEHGEGIMDQIDLYLEGSDQHRGWFHTSLLTSIGTRGRAPYKRVLTHGFVVDGSGKKFSKSAKNFVPPAQLINKHGAEILRLWVASEDYRDDIRFSDEILTRCIEAYRKIRNTARYILGNISDFVPDRDLVPQGKMEEIDRWALSELDILSKKVMDAYESFEFHTVFHALNRFCSVEMSSFYLDILKDRLYTEKKDGLLRRSAQTALWRILEQMTRLMAPIFTFTADEIWRIMPKSADSPAWVFLAQMPDEKDVDAGLVERWKKLGRLRTVVQKSLETARAEKFIGNALEAKVIIECSNELRSFLESFGANLMDLFIVSNVEFSSNCGVYPVEGDEGGPFKVSIAKAEGEKCARCWKYSTSVNKDEKHPGTCTRCAGVLL